MRTPPNLYAYVGNDPVNAVDPTGLYPVCHLEDDSIVEGELTTVRWKEVCQEIDEFEFSLASVPSGAPQPLRGPPNGCIQPFLDAAHDVMRNAQQLDRNSERLLDGAALAAVLGVAFPVAAPELGAAAGVLASASTVGSSIAAFSDLSANTYASVVTGDDEAFAHGGFRAFATLLPSSESVVGQLLTGRFVNQLKDAYSARPPTTCPSPQNQ